MSRKQMDTNCLLTYKGLKLKISRLSWLNAGIVSQWKNSDFAKNWLYSRRAMQKKHTFLSPQIQFGNADVQRFGLVWKHIPYWDSTLLLPFFPEPLLKIRASLERLCSVPHCWAKGPDGSLSRDSLLRNQNRKYMGPLGEQFCGKMKYKR